MMIGYRLVHAGIALISLKNAVAYSPLMGKHIAAGPQILTVHGELMWLYVALWAVSAAWSGYAAVTGRGLKALLVFIFLSVSWGGGYAAAWVFADFTTMDIMTAATYMGIALVTAGVYRVIDQTKDRESRAITAAVDRLERERE